MKKYVTVALACVTAMGLMSALSGCAQEQAPEPAVQQEQKAPEYQVIGKQAPGSYEVMLTNGLPGNIAALSIKLADEDEFPVSMLAAGTTLAAGDTAKLYYAPEATAAKDAAYDVLVTTSDGVTYILHRIDLANMQEASLEYGDEVAYVSYVDAQGKKSDTKQAALDALAAEKAAAEAAAAEAAAAEVAAAEAAAAEEAAQEPVYQDLSSEEPAYVAPGGGSTGGSGDSGSSGPSQSEDQCVDGGVMLR